MYVDSKIFKEDHAQPNRTHAGSNSENFSSWWTLHTRTWNACIPLYIIEILVTVTETRANSEEIIREEHVHWMTKIV